MAHVLQEEYGKITDAKLRASLTTKNGVVFNTKYEGQATAGAVKIPVRDTEVATGNYSKTSIGSNSVNYGSTAYITATIDNDKFVNEYIDGYEAAALPDNLVADRLDSAGYSLALAVENAALTTIVNALQGKDKAGTTFGSTDVRYQKTGKAETASDDIYADLTKLGADLDKAYVPRDGRRYALVDADTLAAIMNSTKAIRQGDLAQNLIQQGVVAQMAGFNIISTPLLATLTANSTLKAKVVAGHPDFATRVEAWQAPIGVYDGNGDANVVGGSFVKGRKVFTHEVTKPHAFAYLKASA